MSEGRYGATVVWTQDGARQVAGIVTDGDLRRAMAQGGLDGKCAGDLASTSPKVLDASHSRPGRAVDAEHSGKSL